MVTNQFFSGGGSVMTRQRYRQDDAAIQDARSERHQKQLFLGGYINLTYEESVILEQTGRSNFGPIASRRYRR